MKKKKILALSLATLMAVSVVGCGAPKQPGAEGGSSNEAKKGQEGIVELTFMGWEASPLETKAVEEGIKAFEKENPNIKVTYTPGLAGSEYNAKLLSSAAAKALPDVMFVASESYRQIVSKGALMELTDKFNEDFPLDDFIDSSRQIMEVDGKVYGISACTVSPIVYYNKDVFDAAGISYPSADPAECWTIDEFREIAKELTSDEIYGVYGLETVADTLNAQILSNGGTRYNEDFTKSTMNTPEVKEVFETIKAIRVEDGSWSLQELADSGMNIGMAPLPSYGEVLTTGQAHLHAISATTEHPEEAWKFLQFLSGMEYQGELCKSGLWMPNRYSLYEEDAVAQWYDEKVHGDSYKLMLDYFKDAAVDPGALQKSTQARDIIAEETDMYFKQDQDIDVILQNLDSRIDEAIAEALQQ